MKKSKYSKHSEKERKQQLLSSMNLPTNQSFTVDTIQKSHRKRKSASKKNKIEEITISVPVINYYTELPYKFVHNGKELEVKVNGDTEENTIIKFENYLQTNVDLHVKLVMDNTNIQRDGLNIIYILQFAKEYEGYESNYNIPLQNNQVYNVFLSLVDGYEQIIENEGLKSSSGEIGKYIIRIQLV